MKTLIAIAGLLVSLNVNAATDCSTEAAKQGNPAECRVPTSASAEPAGCKIDAKKHCAGFGANDGLMQCLGDHQHELTSTCRAALKPATPLKK